MKFDKASLLLYVVTDRSWLLKESLAVQVEETIKAGATFIQLREKDVSFDEFVKIAKEIKAITDQYKVPFVINDNVDVAIAVDADGVHIGQSDEALFSARKRLGRNKIIGVSTQTLEQSLKAQENGADYVGIGAVFPTSTKQDADTLTMERLKEICKGIAIPAVAIGGMTKENLIELSGSGVAGVAVISAIFAQKEIGKATGELLDILTKGDGLFA